MKRLAIMVLLFSSIFTGMVTASEFPILSNQVGTRQAHLEWMLTVQVISIEAVIEYIDEISEGKGMSQLESILTDFRAQVENIQSYTTHVGLNNYLRALKELTNAFRIETRSRMTEYNGKGMVLLVRISTKIEENQGQLDALKEQYWGIRKETVLENFDIRVERAQNLVTILEERGFDISEAQNKLGEINLLRGELEAALDERDNIEILRVSLEALELSKELAEIVRSLQVDIRPRRILQHWVNVGDRVVERTGVIIGELKSLGLDTESLETIHEEAELHLAEAESNLEDGDLVGTAEALAQLVEDLVELRDAYIDLVFPDGFPDDIKDAMDNLGQKLEDIADKLEESLDDL
jgi:hypothetical protein